jgi:SagB-type dehydrogenase family enzyme
MRGKYAMICLLVIGLALFYSPVFSQDKDIGLQEPKSSIAVDLMNALQLRKSTKSFSTGEVSMEDISTILWSANGVNRENGKRTAPSSYGKYYMNLYIAGNTGVYMYDPDMHKLILVTDENIKKQIAKQDYVGEASHIIVMTTELSKFHPMVSEQAKIPTSFATSGFIGQNIYLITNALNLGTAYVVGIKKEIIKEKLNLQEGEIPICVMPIGYPKE